MHCVRNVHKSSGKPRKVSSKVSGNRCYCFDSGLKVLEFLSFSPISLLCWLSRNLQAYATHASGPTLPQQLGAEKQRPSHQRCHLGRETDSRNLPGSRQVRLLPLHQAAHHSHSHTRQKMSPGWEGICWCLQHPRCRSNTHPPSCLQGKTYRCGARQQFEYLINLLGESHEKK